MKQQTRIETSPKRWKQVQRRRYFKDLKGKDQGKAKGKNQGKAKGKNQGGI